MSLEVPSCGEMSQSAQPTCEESRCWCGNSNLEEFSADYWRCRHCETLVNRRMPGTDISDVTGNSQDFYGLSYWCGYQQSNFGYPDIEERAWRDLPERCLHWLQTLLKYKRPPARVLELGCAHGGFVALLRWAGFDATGLELSPSVVEFARKTFDVPVFQGPVERQDIPAASLDVIALMDVLEHLPDPVSTMRHCLGLLRPDGLLLVQTPKYPAGRSYASMFEANDAFLEQLKPHEHLYLFSEPSARAFFERVGALSVRAEPAIFSRYDQFLIAGKSAIGEPEIEDVRLAGSPAQRMVQMLLDFGQLHKETEQRLADAEEDRAARLRVIQDLGERVGRLEAVRNDLAAELSDLRECFARSEADREARLAVIHQQAASIEAERSAHASEMAGLHFRYEAAERDRAARLDVIESQGRELGVLEGRFNDLKHQLAALQLEYGYAEAGTVSLKASIESLEAELRTLSSFVAGLEHSLTGRALKRLNLVTFPRQRD